MDPRGAFAVRIMIAIEILSRCRNIDSWAGFLKAVLMPVVYVMGYCLQAFAVNI